MMDKIQETVKFLKSQVSHAPKIAMITGTGLGALTERIEKGVRIEFGSIPHFPISTCEGHKGTLVVGMLDNVPIAALEGRFHLYEGYSPQSIAFPVRVLAAMGAQYLFISSATGGLNPQFSAGDLMAVTDHINLTGTNPLVGDNVEECGPRFPEMTSVYSRELISCAHDRALESGISLQRGVYAGVLGPSLETPAETRFLRIIGADAVGMSTVTEVIAAAHCGLKVLAIVVITNMNLPDCMESTSIEEVLSTAARTAPKLTMLWEEIVRKIGTM